MDTALRARRPYAKPMKQGKGVLVTSVDFFSY